MFNQLLELGLPLVSFKDFDPSQILSVLGRRNKKYLLLNPALQQRSLKLFLSLLSKLCSSFKDVVIVVNYKDSTFIDNLKVTLNKNSKVSIVYSSEINLLNKILKQHSLSSTLVISLFINDKTELRHIFIESSKYNDHAPEFKSNDLNKEFGLCLVVREQSQNRDNVASILILFQFLIVSSFVG
jgi:hypothetical protein